MDKIHQTNILIHIFFGCVTLALGLFILIAAKGTFLHKKLGRLFLFAVTVVIATAIGGVFLFKLSQFLFIISLVSGYEAWSGYRVIRNKQNGPQWVDYLVSLVVLGSGVFFLAFYQTSRPNWSPVIIYSTVSWLFVLCVYDLLRFFITKAFLQRNYVYEHIVKVVGAFAAICSAFLGTVLPNYQPYSQLGPTVFGFVLILSICVQHSKKVVGRENVK